MLAQPSYLSLGIRQEPRTLLKSGTSPLEDPEALQERASISQDPNTDNLET